MAAEQLQCDECRLWTDYKDEVVTSPVDEKLRCHSCHATHLRVAAWRKETKAYETRVKERAYGGPLPARKPGVVTTNRPLGYTAKHARDPKCGACRGTGLRRQSQRGISTCTVCGGTGIAR